MKHAWIVTILLLILAAGASYVLYQQLRSDPPGFRREPRNTSLRSGISIPHPTAGAIVVGARYPLIAYNIMLDSDDLGVAQDIARAIRTSSGGLPFLKALGLRLSSRGRVQVSMNLTNFRETPLHVVIEAVKREAEKKGVSPLAGEFVGLVPREALSRAASEFPELCSPGPDQILETRLWELLEKDQ